MPQCLASLGVVVSRGTVPDCTAPNVKLGVMVYSCFSAAGFRAVAYKDIMDNFMLLKMWLQFGDWSSLLPYYSTPVHQSRYINRWVSEFGVESSEPN